ncbi:hypothetical protein UT300003_06970 [Clostridium sardiniense]|uniref:prepilin-type N-terminal cleavage/methylation domain-containing protein n=1 Tax=Clostridium sardiniense TaxID=29369 RepID=UPI00195CE7C9|nr:prepilin-type N-terminal cleavage/methylation domain-containing protein [Clostridium sardiniense]MBM7835856.1 prepilin-type N-terminal cleavage/methylation domain-containing protein [Clostridium sardiniense]
MRRGVTIIEVIAVIAILSIIFVFGGSSISYYKRLNRDVEVENFLSSFKHIVTEGKISAIDTESNLKIKIENSNKKIKLMNGHEEINSIEMPEYIQLNRNGIIDITSEGQVKAGTTILDNTKDKEKYFISIRVGVDYINIEKKKI